MKNTTLKIIAVLALVLLLSIIATILVFGEPISLALIITFVSKIIGIVLFIAIAYIIKAMYTSTSVRDLLGL